MLDVSGSPSMINAMRRIMSNELPVLAVERVEIMENSSAMFNEVLVHRLGLIPLSFSENDLEHPENVVLILDKQGPAKVMASDLKSTSDTVKPMYPDMPIVELSEGQNLKLNAYASVGRGTMHAKWKSAIVGYRNYVKVKIKNYRKEMAKYCEHLNGEKMSFTIPACEKCDYASEIFPDDISITPINRYLMTIESVSGHSVDSLIRLTAKEISRRTSEIADSL